MRNGVHVPGRQQELAPTKNFEIPIHLIRHFGSFYVLTLGHGRRVPTLKFLCIKKWKMFQCYQGFSSFSFFILRFLLCVIH